MDILDRVTKACKNHKIHNIIPIGNYSDGHYGVKIILSKKELNFSCEPVEIGIVMYYYGVHNNHFINLLTDDLRNQIDNYHKSCNLF
jgi:hypothetical protein